MLTDLDLPPDAPEPDRCGSCRACVDACPTGALDGSGRIEPRLCLAYQTIEAKSAMPEALRRQMGNRVFGCDACLAACPWGKGKETPPVERPDLAAVALADLAALDEAGFRHLFAGTPVSRTGRDRFVAQVLIALANCGDGAVRPLGSFVGGKSPGEL
jgi:epoxyqueuosine reductase